MYLSSSRLRLQFSETGELTELYDEALQRNYLDAAPRLPLFRITFSEFLNGKIQPGEFHLSSALAEEVTIERNDSEPDTLSITFKHIDGQDLNAFCSVRLPEDSALSYWQIRIENHTDYAIKAVEYPMIATHLTPSGKAGAEIENTRILLPKQDGYLLPCPLFMPWEGDNASRTRNQRFLYPGEGREDPNGSSVQLQAFYDELGGLYMATHDSSGNVKEFGPVWVHEEDATRLTEEEFSQYADNASDRTAGTESASSAENAADPSGYADGISSGDPWLTDSGYLDFSIVHHTPEAPGNVFAPDYDTVIGCFEGDWQDAALIYKAWSKT